MKLDPKILIALQKLIPKHRGVFSISDLQNLLLARTAVEAQQKLRPFLKEKILLRFCRGFYVAPEFDMQLLSQRLCPASAISLGTVLAENLVIGSIPQKTVYAVKIGKGRVYKSTLGQVVHLGFANATAAKEMWFGYMIGKFGIRKADNEKAFLDVLYFYQLGHKFSFNIYSDIQTDRLDHKKLKIYLAHYRNPKFVSFVEGVLSGKHQVG